MGVEVEIGRTINWWAVIVAGVAYWILGAIWYSGGVFGKAWTRGIGKTDEQVKADFSPLNLLWALIAAFLASYGLARIMLWTGGDTIGYGVWLGLVAGVCFVFTTIWMHDSMENRPGSLTVINTLYSIVGFVIMGIIIGAWQ